MKIGKMSKLGTGGYSDVGIPEVSENKTGDYKIFTAENLFRVIQSLQRKYYENSRLEYIGWNSRVKFR